MPGTLYVVATPIGNLEDITLRALRVLREVDAIAAEDTRHTGKLLSHFGISTPTISFHEHNTRTRTPQLVARLEAGESLALVTDAGTPGVSDPGVELIGACVRAGIRVDPLPGPSAPLAAAIASGFRVVPLTVLGFAPSRVKDRTAFLRSVAETSHTVTFFEAPHRIRATLEEAAVILGERPIVVARELTKKYQEFMRGAARDIVGHTTNARGEFTIVVGPAIHTDSRTPPVTDADIVAEFGHMSKCAAHTRRGTVAAVARKFGKSAREVYAAVERAKRVVE